MVSRSRIPSLGPLCAGLAVLALCLVDAAGAYAGESIWSRLEPLARARLLAVLVGLVLLLLALVIIVRLSTSYLLRRMRRNRSRSRLGPDHWAARRLLRRPATRQSRASEPPAD